MSTKEKRILQISTTPLAYDGLTGVFFSLMEYAPKGVMFEVALGMSGEEVFLDRLKSMGIPVHILPSRNASVTAYMKALRRLVKNGGFDIVHIHGNSATMAFDMAAIIGCKISIRVAHGHNTKTNHPALHALLKLPLTLLVNRPAACGKDAGKFLFYKKAEVIPNCIDTKKFTFSPINRQQARKELGIENELLIGNIGRFSYQKNHGFLLEVFASIKRMKPDSKLILIGHGELEREIKEKVERLLLKQDIIFINRSDDIPFLMSAMDIFLLPSRYEGLSVTAIEAQCMGLWLVMSDAVSQETKKTEYCSFIPLSSSSDEWAERIIKLPFNNIKREEASKTIADIGYDYPSLTDKLRQVWEV